MEFKTILHKLTARYRKNPLFSYFLMRTGSDLKNKKWIFILGCYNSGTTLLNQILADHPEISGLPDEGVMLTNQLIRPEDFNWQRMWLGCEKEMEDFESNKQKNPVTIKKHWSHFYNKKDYLIEKSISNILRIPFLNREFKPAYFIHIVRNGYAVAEGIRRKARVLDGNPYSGKESYPIDICARQWVRSLEVVEEQKSSLSNFLEISYEDLTSDPRKELNKITEYLNLSNFKPDYFESSFSVHEKNSKIKNMNNNSFEKLSDEEMKIINEVAGHYLVKYGYELKG